MSLIANFYDLQYIGQLTDLSQTVFLWFTSEAIVRILNVLSHVKNIGNIVLLDLEHFIKVTDFEVQSKWVDSKRITIVMRHNYVTEVIRRRRESDWDWKFLTEVELASIRLSKLPLALAKTKTKQKMLAQVIATIAI